MSPVEGGIRWGQLTYTAVDASAETAAEGTGGWQVKEASAGLTDPERQDLLASISTEISLLAEPPRFPARAEIEALPRRLRFDLRRSGAVWCHSVHAGTDATGRPNNVFNHAVLDRRAGSAAGPESRRPIEAWAAPQWLRPFGAEEVQQARISPEPPVLGSRVTRRAVVDFLLDTSTYRFDTLGLLLDGVAAALAGGPPIVLLAPDPDEGAFWLAAVSYFAAPITCRQVSFSTYERAATVLERGVDRSGPIVTVVPDQDAAGLTGPRGPDVLLVDPRVSPRIRTVDGIKQRETEQGRGVPVTDWSRLVLNVCAEPAAEVVACLERLDQVCAEVAWPAEGPLSWPVAAAVVVSPGFSLARELAVEIATRHAPVGRLGGELRAALRRYLTTAVHSPAEAWARLASTWVPGQAPTEMAVLALETYLRQALADRDWLLAPEPAALPELARRLGQAEVAGLVRALEPDLSAALDALVEGGRAGASQAMFRLRLLDFVTRMERELGSTGISGRRLDGVVADIADVLCGQRGPELAARVGPLSQATLLRLAPALRPGGEQDWPAGPLGERLDPVVRELFRPAYLVDRLLTLPHAKLEENQLAVELLVTEAIDPALAGPDQDGRRVRVVAAALLLRNVVLRYDTISASDVAEVLGQLEGDDPWSAYELEELLRRGGELVAPYLVPELLARVSHWSADEGAGELAQRLKRLAAPPLALRDQARRRILSEPQQALLNLLAETEPGWYRRESGLNQKSGWVLGWAAQAWPWLAERERQAIAPRVILAAYQVALALAVDPADRRGVMLRQYARAGGEAGWRDAVDDHYLPAALPDLVEMLLQNREFLARAMIRARTRQLLGLPDSYDVQALTLSRLPTTEVVLRRVLAALGDRAVQIIQVEVGAELRDRWLSDDDRAPIQQEWERLLASARQESGQPAEEPASSGGRFRIGLPWRFRGGKE